MSSSLRARLPGWFPGSTRYSCPLGLGGYKRVYHVHIRKTAGTSINHAFLKLGDEDEGKRYLELAAASPHRLDIGKLRYVGWDIPLINKGSFFYAFSHEPLWNVNLPAGTYAFTCLRDPIQRVFSHYKMLMEYRKTGFNHPCREIEDKWVGDGFLEFTRRMPKEHLLNQLWMFSRSFDVTEAVGRLRCLSRVIYTEKLRDGMDMIQGDLGLSLACGHQKKSLPEEFEPDSLTDLRTCLAPEYEMIARLQSEAVQSPLSL